MGTTFNHSHIFIGGKFADESRDQVITKIRQRFSIAGYQEVSDSDVSQLTISILPSDANTPWISVYGWDFGSGAEFTQLISNAVKQPVMNIELHDSDVAVLALYQNHKKRDIYSNWINFDKLPPKRSGNATRWANVLPEGVTSELLEVAWEEHEGDQPFTAEGAVQRIAKLLRLDAGRLWDIGKAVDLPQTMKFTLKNIQQPGRNRIPFEARLRTRLDDFFGSKDFKVEEYLVRDHRILNYRRGNFRGSLVGFTVGIYQRPNEHGILEYTNNLSVSVIVDGRPLVLGIIRPNQTNRFAQYYWLYTNENELEISLDEVAEYIQSQFHQWFKE